MLRAIDAALLLFAFKGIFEKYEAMLRTILDIFNSINCHIKAHLLSESSSPIMSIYTASIKRNFGRKQRKAHFSMDSQAPKKKYMMKIGIDNFASGAVVVGLGIFRESADNLLKHTSSFGTVDSIWNQAN
jgi:hypothetical protein